MSDSKWRASGKMVRDTTETMAGMLLIHEGPYWEHPKAACWDDETRQKIVQAVNCHDDLVLGCQAALAYLADPPSKFEENRKAAVGIIEAALAKVRKSNEQTNR